MVLTFLLECKMEKRNSQCEHGQPMKQTRSLFCTCNSVVARCQSQHQCHIWRMNLMFKANCTGKCAWQLSINCCVVHEAISKDSLKDRFESVNIKLWCIRPSVKSVYPKINFLIYC